MTGWRDAGLLRLVRRGLRIVDIADPGAPQEVGHFIPHPANGRVAPQTNDVDADDRGLVYIVDRYTGFDIVEFARGINVVR